MSISSGSSAVVSAPTKKSARLDPALAVHRLRAQAAAEREHDGRHFRSRIGMREIAADGAAVADLRMRDVRQRFVDQRQFALRHRIALEAAVARQRADAQAVAGAVIHAGKLVERIDIDQHGRLGQPEIHCRDKALTAGQEARLVAVFGLQLQGLLDGPGGNIAERRGFHIVVNVPESGDLAAEYEKICCGESKSSAMHRPILGAPPCACSSIPRRRPACARFRPPPERPRRTAARSPGETFPGPGDRWHGYTEPERRARRRAARYSR